MYKCKICGREFEKKQGHNGHQASHSGKPRVRRKDSIYRAVKTELNKTYQCKYCQKIFERPGQIGGHTVWCHSNPNREKQHEKVKFINANKKQKHSQETKDKISKIRIKYLQDNPNKVPFRLNHASKKSYPEVIFENALLESGIVGWKYNYQVGLYGYDFGFPDLKIDVEVDGGTHNSEKVQKIDKRRDEFSVENGWIVLRFEAQLVKKHILRCIENLKLILSERSNNIESESRVIKYKYNASMA